MTKRALITGITGQDGSYLAELLLRKGYEVHGLIRRASTFNTPRIDHLYVDPHDPDAKLFLHYGDLSDGARLVTLLRRDRPRRGLQPRRAVPRAGLVRRARAHRRHHRHRHHPPARGGADGRASTAASTRRRARRCSARPRRRRTRTRRSTRARRTARRRSTRYWITRNYREAYGMFAVNGILFNHESPAPRRDLRDPQDHPRRRRASRPAEQDYVYMGNLDAVRDWGYAPEYVEGMWRMLQADEPDDYVLATGVGITVRDFLEIVVRARRARLGEARAVRRALPAPHRGRRADRRRRRRPTRSSAGRRRSTAASWPGSWSTPTSRRSSTQGTPWIDRSRSTRWPTPGGS